MAYSSKQSEGTAPSVRAHKIRAGSASLTFAHTQSLKDVLDAAFWRSEDPFIDLYFWDISRLREDGSYGIASAVVAQHRISSRRAL